MTTMTRHATGMFCWPQLTTTDLEGAKRFYSGLFGWKTEENRVEGSTITLVKKADKIVGAVMADAQSGPPSWIDFVCVDSADEIANRVKKSGGTVLIEPRDASTNGRMAVFQDPTTAVFAVWQPGTKPGADVVNEASTMCWNELITTDGAKATTFYKSLFGWTDETAKGINGPYTLLKKDGAMAAGLMQATPEMKLTRPYWLIYFAVDDCDASAAKAQQLSGKVMMKPTDIPDVGRFAVITDPQGAWFAIMQPKSPQQTRRA